MSEQSAENDVAALLAQHLPGDYTHLFFDDPGAVNPPVGCRCGWRHERGVSHHHHVARVLIAARVIPPAERGDADA